MPNASDISDSIEPGSLPYGDRQVVEENIQQAATQRAPQPPQGQALGRTQDKLASGSISDLPVTDGLSVGPGAGVTPQASIEGGANIDKFRLLAANGRNPVIRKMARDAIRATLNRG